MIQTAQDTHLIPDDCLDLRGTPCPINFVRTKLKLEQMKQNSLLEVWLDAGEPIEQVPDSLVMEGYKLEKIEQKFDNNTEFFSVWIWQVRGEESL